MSFTNVSRETPDAPRYSSYQATDAWPRFLRAAARAVFVSAYASAADQGELVPSAAKAGHGEAWEHAAPATPRSADLVVMRMLGRWEGKSGVSAETMLSHLAVTNGWTWYGDSDPDWEWIGGTWALSAFGHGVSLWDDGAIEPRLLWSNPPSLGCSGWDTLSELAPRLVSARGKRGGLCARATL